MRKCFALAAETLFNIHRVRKPKTKRAQLDCRPDNTWMVALTRVGKSVDKGWKAADSVAKGGRTRCPTRLEYLSDEPLAICKTP